MSERLRLEDAVNETCPWSGDPIREDSLTLYRGQFGINVPATMAAVVLSTLPMLVVFVLARRQLVAGLTAGFSK